MPQPAENGLWQPAAPPANAIVFDNVSRFYGDVLGVNRVAITIGPGITSLVGPNGSGKTTLMNLMTGLLWPTRGTIRVLGIATHDPERLFRQVGYAAQFDSFPRGMTGLGFVEAFLRLSGHPASRARLMAREAVDRVHLAEAATRKIAGYSKGMRQRIKLAQALAHDPQVLVLDEPLNGLDPLVRSQTIDLFKELAARGRHVVVSSHVLHEVDMISDRMIMLSNGYVVAEGQISNVRSEIRERPMQVLIQCDRPAALASRLFAQQHVVEATLVPAGGAVLVKTRDASGLYRALNRLAAGEINVQGVAPADDDMRSVYGYLIDEEGGGG